MLNLPWICALEQNIPIGIDLPFDKIDPPSNRREKVVWLGDMHRDTSVGRLEDKLTFSFMEW